MAGTIPQQLVCHLPLGCFRVSVYYQPRLVLDIGVKTLEEGKAYIQGKSVKGAKKCKIYGWSNVSLVKG